MSFDLRDVIPEEDYKKIENYFEVCGFPKDSILSVRDYLVEWAKNKGKLYRMLGKNLKVSIPCEFNKPQKDIEEETYTLFNDFIEFRDNYRKFFDNIIEKNKETKTLSTEDARAYKNIKSLMYVGNFIHGTTSETIKIKPEGFKKTLQLQKGTKIIRAISKIVSYFGAENFPDFEEFRCRHSLIYNDKKIKGNLTISIHPLDFITMSDNSLDWTSCMSWIDEGCYHLGTVEMMNSNNVVCCYMEGSTPYDFAPFAKERPEDKDLKDYVWNNKKWRQMFYVTKDIIVSGKAYPYIHVDLTKTILSKLRELAQSNFNWTYQYGPELYKDMKYIWSANRMDRNRLWVAEGTSLKHNILFDTKNMYNDMLNDNNYNYYCVRNKVKKEKIISYSGKARCISCNKILLEESDYTMDYNDRYLNTGKVMCSECREESKCDVCGELVGVNNIINFSFYEHGDTTVKICKNCFKSKAKKCPICQENFLLPYAWSLPDYRLMILKKPFELHEDHEFYFPKTSAFNYGYCCRDCFDKIKSETLHLTGFHVYEVKEKYWNIKKIVISDNYYKDAIEKSLQPFLQENLKPATL